MTGVILGIALGLASAFAINWSFFVQHGAVNTIGALSLRRPFSALRTLFSNPRWLLGYGAGWIGWIVYVVALRFAPLSLVQASASGGIGFLALFCHRKAASRLAPRDQRAIVGAILGLALLAASLGAGIPRSRVGTPGAVLAAIGVLLVLAALAAGPLARVLHNGPALGIASGCAYAAADVGAKAAVAGRLWYIPLLLACSVGGFVAQQLAFQRGSALSTVGPATLVGSACPILAGPLVFHEQIPANVFGVLRVAGFLAVVIGATVLARPDEPDATPTSEREATAAPRPAPVPAAGRS